MDDFEFIKDQWNKQKLSIPENEVTASHLMQKAKKNKRKSQLAHLYTIIILSTTLIVLLFFFVKVAPFQQLLSHIGIVFMCGGLFLRIIMEVVSASKAAKITTSMNALNGTNQAVEFYQFRLKMHGTITYVIVAAYIIGFYMLTPEFMLYLALKWILIMDIGFVFIALVLFLTIRKGVLTELSVLKELAALKEDLVG
jgi:cation transport ATPase